jgi:hypothetical protein
MLPLAGGGTGSSSTIPSRAGLSGGCQFQRDLPGVERLPACRPMPWPPPPVNPLGSARLSLIPPLLQFGVARIYQKLLVTAAAVWIKTTRDEKSWQRFCRRLHTQSQVLCDGRDISLVHHTRHTDLGVGKLTAAVFCPPYSARSTWLSASARPRVDKFAVLPPCRLNRRLQSRRQVRARLSYVQPHQHQPGSVLHQAHLRRKSFGIVRQVWVNWSLPSSTCTTKLTPLAAVRTVSNV